MQTLSAVQVVGYMCLEREVGDDVLRLPRGIFHHLAFLVGGEVAEQRVQVGQLLGLYLGQGRRVVFSQWFLVERVAACFLVELVAHAVIIDTYGVQVAYYLSGGLRLGVAGEIAGVGQVELAVEVEEDGLVSEGLAAVGHLGHVAHVLLFHVLEPLAAPQCQQQVLLLLGRLHLG